MTNSRLNEALGLTESGTEVPYVEIFRMIREVEERLPRGRHVHARDLLAGCNPNAFNGTTLGRLLEAAISDGSVVRDAQGYVRWVGKSQKVCPRCLDIEPGTPGGTPDDPHPGPFSDDLCVPCGRNVAKDQANSAFGTFPPCACGKGAGCFDGNVCIECFRSAQKDQWKTKPIAPHAIAVQPMRVCTTKNPNGPLRMALSPRDFDGLGREMFWDQTPEERATALPAMVSEAGAQLDKLDPKYWNVVNENRIFARAWLNELERVRNRTT